VKKKISERIGDRRSYRTVKIYDFKQPLDKPKEYMPGQPLTYKFQIKIPANVLNQASIDGALGKVVKAAQFLQGTTTRIRWYLRANLDVPMAIDVSKKINLNIA
jgi:hypothetical protein